MNNLHRLILVIIISLSFINSSVSDDNIGFVNVDYLIQNSNIGKKLLSEINNKDKKNIENNKKPKIIFSYCLKKLV